jgi:hypothetical protein
MVKKLLLPCRLTSEDYQAGLGLILILVELEIREA